MILTLDTDLSLMRAHLAGQVKEAVTVSTQISTLSTQDDGWGDAVIVIVTGGLQTSKNLFDQKFQHHYQPHHHHLL